MYLKRVVFTITCNCYTTAVAQSIYKAEDHSHLPTFRSSWMSACLWSSIIASWPIVLEVELESTALLDSICVQQQVDAPEVLELHSVIASGTTQWHELILVWNCNNEINKASFCLRMRLIKVNAFEIQLQSVSRLNDNCPFASHSGRDF